MSPRRPKLDPTEHPRPHVDVPMSVFSDPLFRDDYARLGRWVHMWCYAVWKKDPTFRPLLAEDGEVQRARTLRWLVGPPSKLRLTGPLKDERWLLSSKRTWSTYAIEAVGQNVVKVGKATDVTRRLEGLQIASAHYLRLLGTVERDVEAVVHKLLRGRGLHMSGEWFRLDNVSRGILSAHGLINPEFV